ncbi:MAG: hypothetical protein C0417_02850 [Chlorobiaceae bacterium]|nr:hypothetical protein [Chlorobiaceae bacterium]
MGESFVALHNSSSGSYYNPATIRSDEEFSISFNKRYFNWMKQDPDMFYTSFNSIAKTEIGTFEVFYNKFHMQRMQMTTPTYPEGTGVVNYYDHTFGFAYVREFASNLSAGLTLKTFNFGWKSVSSIVPIKTSKTTTHPLIVDLGFFFSHSPFLVSKHSTDNISFGLSFQNFGSDFLIEHKYQKIPRYARIGFSYRFSMNKIKEEMFSPLKSTITLQYCNLLNQYKENSDAVDYWGAGIETTFYEIASIRFGLYTRPITGIYGVKGNPEFRYGFGIIAPLRKLGIETSFVPSFDYAIIPLSNQIYLYSDNPERYLSAFSLELKYEKDLF